METNDGDQRLFQNGSSTHLGADVQTGLREIERDVERAVIAPYLDPGPVPGWFPLAFGAWMAVLMSLRVSDWLGHPALELAAIAVLVLLAGAWAGHVRGRAGVQPSFSPRTMPRELRGVTLSYALAAALLVLFVPTVLASAPVWLVVLVTFAIATALMWGIGIWYERAVERIRGRLG